MQRKIVFATTIDLPTGIIRLDYKNDKVKSGDIAFCERFYPDPQHTGPGNTTVGMVCCYNGGVHIWATTTEGFKEIAVHLLVIR